MTRRTAKAAQWHKLYSLAIWRGKDGLRQQQLSRQPLCERCLQANRIVPAAVVNHKVKHEGDWSLFTDPENLESVCKPHHDSDIQSEERTGYSKAIGMDGWPTDERHPANR